MPTMTAEQPRLRRDATEPPPLSSVLQSLSDICTRASLLHDVPQALIVSDSIRCHIINPLRAYIFTSAPPSFDSLESPTEAYQTASLAYALIEKCLSDKHGFLPVCQIWDTLHRTMLSLSTDSQPYVMLKHVWNDVITILRGQLFLLLVHARISDPREQFFISHSSVVTRNLPSFISIEAAENIYSAYKATKCAISMSDQDFSSSIYPTDQFKHILSDPVSAQLQIESAAMRWRRAASQNVSQFFPFLKVRHRIGTLRKYLLHGESSFWRFFFGLLRNASLPPLTSPESRKKSEKILNRILQTTITEYGVSCPLFELQVRENGEVIPTFTLSFVESQILASRAHVYCDLFSVTFSIRRAACDLQASYMELQAHRKRMTAMGKVPRTKLFVELFELRRRMGCFIDGYEWYIQAQVLQPSIDGLLLYLGRDEEGLGSKRRARFDVVVQQHEDTMERLLTQCFVGERVIMARLQAIVSACLSLGELIRGLSGDIFETTGIATPKESRTSKTLELVHNIERDFSRNYELLVLLLSGLEKRGCGSKVTVLFQQIAGSA